MGEDCSIVRVDMLFMFEQKIIIMCHICKQHEKLHNAVSLDQHSNFFVMRK